ncbi:MAG: hypothetical protein RLZ10_2393 [Bacteroidota bacterium]|jgi:hypothetical protein
MSKIKKYTLSIDEELEFDVVGITSHQLDYRLVWSINSALGIHLSKHETELNVFNDKKNFDVQYSYYLFKDELDRVNYYFLKNKNGIDYLIPELPSVDYFIFLTNNFAIEIDDFVQNLRKIDTILGVFKFDNQKFKSFQYLEFN